MLYGKAIRNVFFLNDSALKMISCLFDELSEMTCFTLKCTSLLIALKQVGSTIKNIWLYLTKLFLEFIFCLKQHKLTLQIILIQVFLHKSNFSQNKNNCKLNLIIVFKNSHCIVSSNEIFFKVYLLILSPWTLHRCKYLVDAFQLFSQVHFLWTHFNSHQSFINSQCWLCFWSKSRGRKNKAIL